MSSLERDDDSVTVHWHNEYKVASPQVMEVRGLQGDKILLPQSALEQILAAAPSKPLSNQDPWQAPHQSSQQLPSPLMFRLSTDTGNVVYAGIREFSADEGEVVLSQYLVEALGLQCASLGQDTWEAPTIKVQARHLPRGTFVRFRPLEAGYDPDDWRALLERHLKLFTTLTKDTILSVRGVKGETFKLLADKFLPEGHAICVVDTDTEVDIEPLNEEQAQETLRQVTQRRLGNGYLPSSIGGVIDIWKPVEGQVARGSYVNYELPSWDKSQSLNIVLDCEGDGHEVDLFGIPWSSRQRVFPTAEEHIWADMSSHRTKIITIRPTNVALDGAEAVRISVYGYASPSADEKSESVRRYTIRMQSGDPSPSTSRKMYDPLTEDHVADDELCSNCKRWVPKSAATMHAIFCARNNEVCTKCYKVFKRGDPDRQSHWHCDYSADCDWGDTPQSLDKHRSIFHEPSRECWEPTCTRLKGLTLPQLAEHRTTTCPGKLILCQFCHLEVSQEGDDPLSPSAETLLTGLTAHELAEGNRTTNCELCARIVRLRELAAHMKNHDIERENQPKPTICRNALCGRTLHGVGKLGPVGALQNLDYVSGTGDDEESHAQGNAIGLCGLCFSPLWVNTHDPQNKALRRRVERRYLGQLMTGCGKAWCENRWCRTGRGNLGLEPKPSGVTAALKEVKPLVEAAFLGVVAQAQHQTALGEVVMKGGNKDRDGTGKDDLLWFCTDEANQRNKVVAEGIASEGFWELEWAVAGCEAWKGEEGKVREWLGKYAARRKR